MYSLKRFIVNSLLIFIPESRFYGLKRLLYRFLGCQIMEGARICSSAKIYATGGVYIGKDVFVGPEVVITSSKGGRIIIEDYVVLSIRSVLVNGFHELTPNGNSIIGGKDTTGDIVIKKGTVINTMSIVLPGKTVGCMAVVGAGSVITKDVADYAVVGGAPARFIKDVREK